MNSKETAHAVSQPGLSASLAALMYRNRYALVLFVLVSVLAGWSALVNLPRIEDPRITNRFTRIVTLLPGSSAERVEALVTDPIEDALREFSEIKKIESTSKANLSSIALELQDNIKESETDQIYSKIRNRLGAAAATLPSGAIGPTLDDKVSAVAYSLIIGVSWEHSDESPLNLLTRTAEQVADKMRELPGTDVVRLFGAPEEEISVTVNSAEMAALGLSTRDIARVVAAGDPKGSAGAVRNSQRDLLVEVAGDLDSARRVGSLTLTTSQTGGRVALSDIADVRRAWREPTASLARSNQRRTIFVAVHTEPDIRIDRWAKQAHQVMDDFQSNQAHGVSVETVFEQAAYTQDRLAGLSENLGAGALVVMLVVFLGMGWRAALVVGLALPLSASLTLFGLTFTEQQIHQMTIFGMIVAIGLLIDNAIVMTDEIKQRRDSGMARLDAVISSVRHLFVPLLASTLTTILGFMPVFLLPGASGDFVGPIALAVVLALCASFTISISVIPALAGLFLPQDQALTSIRWLHSGVRFTGLGRWYRKLLTRALAFPLLTVLVCLLLPIAGFFLAGTLNQEFFPAADRDQFEIEIFMPAGSSTEETSQFVRRIEQNLNQQEGVIASHILVGGTFPTIYYNSVIRRQNDSTYAHIMVYTDSVTSAQQLVRDLQPDYAQRFPQAHVIIKPFAQGPPIESPVGYRIEGPDIDTLRVLGQQVRRIMHTVPGITATRATITGGQAQLVVHADQDQVRLAGLELTQVVDQLQTGLEGGVGGSVLEDVESLPVRIRLDSSDRASIASLSATQLQTRASSSWVPLNSLGDVTLEPAVSSISRYNGVRVNRILGYLSVGSFAIDIAEQIEEALDAADFTLPPGYAIKTEGDAANQGDALGDLLIYLPILIMLMIATLVLSFRSVTLAFGIICVAMLSVGLGLFALWLGQFPLGFTAIIGSVGLVGVAINGTIVVLASIRSDELATAGDREAIVTQTSHTTRHILSTTLTTIGGFAPLLLFTEGDFWPPLATVIAGGVGFSMTLSLFFTPAIYRLLAKLRMSFPVLFMEKTPV